MSADKVVRIAPGTHIDLRIACMTYEKIIGRPVSMSQLITAAWVVAVNHDDEIPAALNMEAK